MAAANINPETLDFILETTKAGPEGQARDFDALDAKTINVFSAASVIIGLASFARDFGDWPTTVLFGMALAAYAVVVGGVILAVKVREFRFTSHASNLWSMYQHAEPEAIKRALAQDIAETYDENNVIIKRKALGARVAVFATAGESLFVGAGLLLARIF